MGASRVLEIVGQALLSGLSSPPWAAVDLQVYLLLQFVLAGSVPDQELEEASDLELGSSRVFLASQLAQPPSSRDLMPGKRLASQMLDSSWESKMPVRSFCRKMLSFESKEKYRMPERC